MPDTRVKPFRGSSTARQRPRWFPLVWAIPAALVVLVGCVLIARWLRSDTPVGDFIATYPGYAALPADAPIGFPAWLAWQHFLSAFFVLLLVRSGWLIRTTARPAAFWTRRNSGILRTKSAPKRHSINHWLHFSLDWLWVANGVVFVVMLFVTGQWMRIVPTGWDAFPNAVSATIQYFSLEWPVEDGWANYNALQLLSYFLTVFIAAPLAILSGIRLSPLWRANWVRLSRIYPIELARRIHFPVMIYFVAFVIVHVTLVFSTGAIRNLNHMYATRDDQSLVGLAFFGGSLVLMVAAWILARPVFLAPIARQSGSVGR